MIELKLADGRKGQNLIDTIETQLVPKHLASSDSAAGCLLVTLGKNREWHDPVTGELISFEELKNRLEEKAKAAAEKRGGAIHLHVELLDLRPSAHGSGCCQSPQTKPDSSSLS